MCEGKPRAMPVVYFVFAITVSQAEPDRESIIAWAGRSLAEADRSGAGETRGFASPADLTSIFSAARARTCAPLGMSLERLSSFKIHKLYTAFRRDEPASPLEQSLHPDIGFLDDSRPSHYSEDIQGLFASAFHAESRLQSHAGR
jgi:hypothetical protein